MNIKKNKKKSSLGIVTYEKANKTKMLTSFGVIFNKPGGDLPTS